MRWFRGLAILSSETTSTLLSLDFFLLSKRSALFFSPSVYLVYFFSFLVSGMPYDICNIIEDKNFVFLFSKRPKIYTILFKMKFYFCCYFQSVQMIYFTLLKIIILSPRCSWNSHM